MKSSNLQDRIEAIERITKLFKIERFIYIAVLCLSLLILFITITLSLFKKGDITIILPLMFGSGGLVTVTIGGILYMWNRSLKIIAPEFKGNEE
jgi:hypothetical protein